MKNGRTHIAYKAEHAVDLETDALLKVKILPADTSDADGLVERVLESEYELAQAGHAEGIAEVVADKGYHKSQTLAACVAAGIRTYIPERKEPNHRRWKKKPAGWQAAFYGNRRRVRGRRGRSLQRLRSEYVERTFAHLCETGGARRTWLRGFGAIEKRYVVHAAARNLGLLMRKCFGVGTPRALQGRSGMAARVQGRLRVAILRFSALLYAIWTILRHGLQICATQTHRATHELCSSTGC